jgi:hypothetical protein
MAVERFRLANGRWPANLDELVPAYIEAIPEDPFSAGNPLRLSAKDDRLIVYSLGIDQDDDGGDVRRGKQAVFGTGDLGFILLVPAARNAPPMPAETQPASAPSAEVLEVFSAN